MSNKKFGVIKKEWLAKLADMSKEEGEKFLERIRNKLHEHQKKVLEEAYAKKLFSKEGYEADFKDMFYDEFGFDGFLQYIDGVMNANADYFVTVNQNLLKKKEELETRFKLKIINPEELEKLGVSK
ncbi:hypothetical protein HYW20_08140 [Candidatus Woesearchaeota archaeon]|nr:hypothetical protein [Candidatus Woesearchaeota archaeon]